MGKYFGTDGFRGEAGVELTSLHAYNVGLYVGYLAVKMAAEGKKTGLTASGRIARPSVLLGRDTRHSGGMLAAALAAGITTMGADVYDAGVITTPGIACLTRAGKFFFGIMVSASHNPYYDNGIKIVNASGEKLEEETIAKIEAFLDGEPIEQAAAKLNAIGKVVSEKDAMNPASTYLDMLEDFARGGCAGLTAFANRPFKGLEIGLDCANGSASAFAPQLFKELGANVLAINCRPDGFNINDKCGSTHIEALCRLVVDNGLDMGFAFDGDADRCLAVDSSGNVVDGDKILYLIGTYLASAGRLTGNTVVTTVMSNIGLYKAFDEAGIAYAKTAVGDKYVYECMTREGYVLGGEQSGHVILGEVATTGDGMMTALMVVQTLLASGKTLKEAADAVRIYPQVLENVRVADKDAVLADKRVEEAIARAEAALGNDGRVLVRKSGTEPLIRVMAEAADEQTCRNTVAAIVEVVKACCA